MEQTCRANRPTIYRGLQTTVGWTMAQWVQHKKKQVLFISQKEKWKDSCDEAYLVHGTKSSSHVLRRYLCYVYWYLVSWNSQIKKIAVLTSPCFHCYFANENNFIGMDHFISKCWHLSTDLLYFLFSFLHLDSLNSTSTRTLKAWIYNAENNHA